MHRRVIPVFFLVTVWTISGCGTNSYKAYNHVDQAAREHIKSVDVYVAVPQDSISLDIKRSRLVDTPGIEGTYDWYAMFVVDAIIDAYRGLGTIEHVTTLSYSIGDYSYSDALSRELDKQLAEIDWLHANEVELENNIEEDWYKEKYYKSTASAVMFVEIEYIVTRNLNAIETRVKLHLLPKDNELLSYRESTTGGGKAISYRNNIYRHTEIFYSPLPTNGTPSENVAALSRNNGELLKNALEESAEKVAREISAIIRLDERGE